MATIGSFSKDDAGNYNGAIKTLTLNVKQATFRKAEKDNDKAPDFRIFAGQTEFGAAWKKTSRENRDYLSVKLDDRDFGRRRWGDAGYAQEELVAELGAAFLCADLGLELTPRDDHAGYIEHWLLALQDDKRAIFTAATHAQRACDFLHGLQPTDSRAPD